VIVKIFTANLALQDFSSIVTLTVCLRRPKSRHSELYSAKNLALQFDARFFAEYSSE